MVLGRALSLSTGTRAAPQHVGLCHLSDLNGLRSGFVTVRRHARGTPARRFMSPFGRNALESGFVTVPHAHGTLASRFMSPFGLNALGSRFAIAGTAQHIGKSVCVTFSA
jgi:hypothetical protein